MKSAKKTYLAYLLVIPVFLLSGCASVQVAEDARGTGVNKIYEKPISEVWTAMKEVVKTTGGKIVEENKDNCSILARYGVSPFSWGERVGVFCSALSQTTTEIEVLSKRAISINITASDWTADIYAALDEKLN